MDANTPYITGFMEVENRGLLLPVSLRLEMNYG